MIKLNNKGFAISTLLYGLMIMIFLIVFALMSIMGSNRKNTKNLVDVIEDELTRYSLTNVYGVYDSSIDDGSGRLYVVPESGWYKIELWGAKGAGYYGGSGAYTSGVIYLEANRHLYIHIGSQGKTDGTGGANGGGTTTGAGNGGGGATDVRYIPVSEGETESLNSRIMVAAGGGGQGPRYNYAPCSGGSAGTLIGNDGYSSNRSGEKALGYGGTQLKGGSTVSNETCGLCGAGNGTFGFGGSASWSNEEIGSGGAGYFGGSSGSGVDANGSGGGGSSYIAGYAGVIANPDDNNKQYQTVKTLTGEFGKYDSNGNPITETITPAFKNGFMMQHASSENGKFRILLVSRNDQNNPPNQIMNTKLENVRYIEDCISGSDDSENPDTAHWTEIQAINSNGENVALGASVISETGTLDLDSGATNTVITDGIIEDSSSTGYATYNGSGSKCVTIDLKQAYDLDEIAVWHSYKDSRTYNNHKIRVSSDNNSWENIRYYPVGAGINFSNELETATGIRYSKFQPDATSTIESGRYYIMSGASSYGSNALTYEKSSVGFTSFTGDSNQEWNIVKQDDGTYQITSAANIKKSLAASDTNIITSDTATKWSVTISLSGNGYYHISIPGTYHYFLTFPISCNQNGCSTELTDANGKATQRFKLVKVDYDENQ